MVLLLVVGLSFAPAAVGVEDSRPRVVLMLDPELDDSNTLVRYLLYSNMFDTEGLVYTSSGVHWKGDGQGTLWFVPGREYDRFGLNLGPMPSWRWKEGEQFIHDAVEIYAEVYPNLKVHASVTCIRMNFVPRSSLATWSSMATSPGTLRVPI